MNRYEHKICLFCLHTKSKLYKKTSKNVEFISPSGVGLSQTIKKTQTNSFREILHQNRSTQPSLIKAK